MVKVIETVDKNYSRGPENDEIKTKAVELENGMILSQTMLGGLAVIKENAAISGIYIERTYQMRDNSTVRFYEIPQPSITWDAGHVNTNQATGRKLVENEMRKRDREAILEDRILENPNITPKEANEILYAYDEESNIPKEAEVASKLVSKYWKTPEELVDFIKSEGEEEIIAALTILIEGKID